jgi:hypothetical protein
MAVIGCDVSSRAIASKNLNAENAETQRKR